MYPSEIKEGQMQEMSKPESWIYIPNINVFLPIEIASVKHEEWTISNRKVAFLGENSAPIGSNGTTAILAHAKNKLFGLLPTLPKGGKIVIASHNKLYLYETLTKEFKEPTDVQFLAQQNQPLLALITCYGTENKKRLVVYARFLKIIDKTLPKTPTRTI